MLASMIFQKEPFFHGQDNYDQVGLSALCVCVCVCDSGDVGHLDLLESLKETVRWCLALL